MKINEVSPDTFVGSFTKDLILSKLWLLLELKNIEKQFDVVYILGSWFGNLSLMMMHEHIKFNKIINVDIDEKSLKTGDKLQKKLGIDNKIQDMVKDANSLDYRQIKKQPSLVINTSVTNMKNEGWFDNIPKGTLVAIQARNNDSGSVVPYDNLKEFKKDFPMSKVYYSKKLKLKDPETTYFRYMIIGIK